MEVIVYHNFNLLEKKGYKEHLIKNKLIIFVQIAPVFRYHQSESLSEKSPTIPAQGPGRPRHPEVTYT